MSFSNPILENPCKKFIDFKSDDKQFVYWDKELGENGEQVIIPTPIYFIVLDELTTITGYYKEGDCGIYSNEIHFLKDEVLKVRTFKKGGPSIVGLYDAIKDSIKAIGGKYTKSVYAMMIPTEGVPEFVNFRFRGAAFSAWLDKKVNTSRQVVCIADEFIEEHNGKTVYNVPVFKAFNMKPEYRDMAVEMDKELQAFLKSYKSKQAEKEEVTAEHPAAEPAQPEPMQAYGGFVKESRNEKQPAVVSDINDLPWDNNIETRKPAF